MENNAAVPHTALPRVNQSAKWNSRIIEKGFVGFGVFIDTQPSPRGGLYASIVAHSDRSAHQREPSILT
jgi:hypothetical protein